MDSRARAASADANSRETGKRACRAGVTRVGKLARIFGAFDTEAGPSLGRSALLGPEHRGRSTEPPISVESAPPDGERRLDSRAETCCCEIGGARTELGRSELRRIELRRIELRRIELRFASST